MFYSPNKEDPNRYYCKKNFLIIESSRLPTVGPRNTLKMSFYNLNNSKNWVISIQPYPNFKGIINQDLVNRKTHALAGNDV